MGILSSSSRQISPKRVNLVFSVSPLPLCLILPFPFLSILHNPNPNPYSEFPSHFGTELEIITRVGFHPVFKKLHSARFPENPRGICNISQ